MVTQTLSFIDGRIYSTINNLTVTDSGTYEYDFALRQSDGTYSIIFTGDMYLEAGSTSKTLDISDLLKYNRWFPTYDDMAPTASSTSKVNLLGIARWRILDSTGAYRQATVYYANVYRYPARLDGLEFTLMSYGVQTGSTRIINMVQGAKVESNSEGLVTSVGGYTLVPRYPVFKRNPIIPFVFEGHTTSSSASVAFKAYYGGSYTSALAAITRGCYTYRTGCRFVLPSAWDSYDYTIKVADPSAGDVTTAYLDTAYKGRYYLMWQDRFGGYQSQPFCKTPTYKESATTYEASDYDNTRYLIQTDVKPGWEINTGWVDESLYPFYESIFVSPALKLTDTLTGVEHSVMLEDREYTEKTFRNQGRKMFNLKLNLSLARTQAISF